MNAVLRAKLRIAALATVPLVALPAAAFLLRWGAPGPVRAARIEGARPDRAGHLAWQMTTAVEERNVREAVPMDSLVAVLRGPFGEKVWHGETDKAGLAEIAWDDVKVAVGDPISLEVGRQGERLAFGNVDWSLAPPAPSPTLAPDRAFAKPSKREGALALDVAIPGGHIVAGFDVPIWIRVQDATTGEAVAGASLAFTPEPGLELTRTQAVTCRAGWAQLGATAIMHVTELGIEAHAGDRAGAWFGGVPVAPGASFVALPRELEADKSTNVDVELIGARDLEYLEIDDDAGRVFGASVPLSLGAEGRRHGHVTLPPLAAGDLWLVTSGAPHGATNLDGATLARPLRVTSKDAPQVDPCAELGDLASRAARPFPRFLALDGFAQRDRSPELRRSKMAKLGATAILGVAGLIETLLLAIVSADSKKRIAAMEGATASSTWRTFGLIALAWLGFALFAGLIWIRG